MHDHQPDVSRRDMLAAGLGTASALLLATGCDSARPAGGPTVTTTPEPLRLSAGQDLRCGMIGTGGRGTEVLGYIKQVPGVKITALCDINADHLNRAAASVAEHAPRLFSGYHTMLAEADLDAVFVETPCYLHAEMAIAVLESGRHCYSEKPMALSVKDLDAMVRAVNRSRRVFQVGTQLPYADPWHGAIEACTSGVIGEPVMIRAHRHYAGDFPHHIKWMFDRTKSGDLILEQAVHEFDIFNAIFESIPTKAAGFGGLACYKTPEGRNTRDHYVLALDYGPNRQVSYSHSWISAPGVPFDGRQIIVTCTEGAVDVEKGMIYPREGEARPVTADAPGNAVLRAVTNFFECVREGRQPLTDVQRGREGALVGLIGLKALDTGEMVTMKDLVRWGYQA